MSTYNLERLFAPRSVAVVGASPRPGSLGSGRAGQSRGLRDLPARSASSIRNIARSLGKPAVPSLARLPFAPDLAIITAPARTPSLPLSAEAGRTGAAGCIIISCGPWSRQGSLAAEVEATAARAHHIRLIGPNCLGAIMPRAKLNASFAAQMPLPGDLALISQSGAIAAAMIDWGRQRVRRLLGHRVGR